MSATLTHNDHPTRSDHCGPRDAVADLARRAIAENRMVLAQREAEAILRRYPKAGLSVDEVVAMITEACSESTGASIAFGK